MRWNEEVKGILKSLKVSGYFLAFEILSNYYPRGELENMYWVFFFLCFPETEVKNNDSTNINVRVSFYIIEKTVSLQ